MIKIAVIGTGKMGLSHLSILGAHPDVFIVGIADTSKLINDVFHKFSTVQIFHDYRKMLDMTMPDAVVVSLPNQMHELVVEELLHRKIHVFVEKPFCMNTEKGNYLVDLVNRYQLINQVGYHNKFIGTFEEAKKIISNNYLGKINHFVGEAYGPVVIKKGLHSWRSNEKDGGGCLMDYASHVIDLLNDLVSPIQKVHGSILKKIFSNDVEDAVYSLLETKERTTGILSVNWSDDTYRKMSTTITINGTDGKLIADATELKVYFKNHNTPLGYSKGWNVKSIIDFVRPINFYLRGEEYSLQLDYFIKSIQGLVPNIINTFESALQTDLVISQIKKYQKQNNEQNLIWG